MSGNRCVHSQIQSYECYVELPDGVCVDRCLAEEVKALRSKGVRTVGCCCGMHTGWQNGVPEHPSYIQVNGRRSIEHMAFLGYERFHDESTHELDACGCAAYLPHTNLGDYHGAGTTRFRSGADQHKHRGTVHTR